MPTNKVKYPYSTENLTTATFGKPMFLYKHHNAVAAMIGQMKESDEVVQAITEKFGEFFQADNPSFNWKWFQSRVTREREGQ